MRQWCPKWGITASSGERHNNKSSATNHDWQAKCHQIHRSGGDRAQARSRAG
jgi:hypothetical protein